jgi:hypothetical protein
MSAQLAAAQSIVLIKVDRVSLEAWTQAEREAKTIKALATIVSELSPIFRARSAFRADMSVQLPLPIEVAVPRVKRLMLDRSSV